MRLHTTLLLVFLWATSLVQAQEVTVDKLFYQAVYAEQIDGDHEKARSLYEQILKSKPDDRIILAKTFYRLGLITEKDGTKQALSYYTKVVEEFPEQKELIELVQNRVDKLESANTFIDPRDGHKYKYVQIGKQIWMAENLAYMPHVNPVKKQEYGIWVYDYDGSDVAEAKATENYQKYGCLYDWPTAMSLDTRYLEEEWGGDPENHQGLCPTGWRMPSDRDWQEMESYLGMPDSLVHTSEHNRAGKFTYLNKNFDSPPIGTFLKSLNTWISESKGNNKSGFNALAAGLRVPDSRYSRSFDDLGGFTCFLTSTEYIFTDSTKWAETPLFLAWSRYLNKRNPQDLDRDEWTDRTQGSSVRCIKSVGEIDSSFDSSSSKPVFQSKKTAKEIAYRDKISAESDQLLKASELFISSNWTKFGRDLHNSGFVEGNISQSEPTLVKKLLQGIMIFSTAVVNDIVYCRGIDSILYAVNLNSDMTVWEFKAEALINTNPVVSDGVIVFASGDKGERRDPNKIYGDKYLYALDIQTGEELWKISKGNELSWNPAVVNKILYIGIGKDFLALDINTGREMWKYALPDGLGSIYSGIAVYNDLAIFGTRKEIIALDLNTRKLKWKFDAKGSVFSSPAISDGILFFGGSDYYFYALDVLTGEKIWRFYTEKSFNWSSPGVAYNTVYFGGGDGNFYSLDIETGECIWKHLHQGETWMNTHPAIADGLVITGLKDRRVVALDAYTGSVNWEYLSDQGSFTNPVIYRGKIIVGGSDGLYILE